MTVALVVLAVCAFGVMFFYGQASFSPGGPGDGQAPSADVTGGLVRAAPLVGFPVVIPKDLPAEWHPNSFTFTAAPGSDEQPAAVRAGARQIQGTLNGLGERCGNANLTSIIPTLLLKPDYARRFETGVTPEKLRTLTHASRVLDEVLNRAPNRHAPYVGEAAFAHKGGIHVSAVQKDPRTYEHVPPEAVGNRRKLLVSDQAGRSNILAELERIGIVMPKDDPRIARLLDAVKQRESQGYAYEAAEASFELLARRMLGNVPQFFEVDSFRVLVERRHNAVGKLVTVSEATVKVRIDGEPMMSVGEGNGPVNALDNALRKDLGRYQRYIDDLDLVDYKVRILTGGTDAVTRVLVESRDGAGNRWFTVGVSPNIVDASFEALLDSINYKLIRDGAPAP